MTATPRALAALLLTAIMTNATAAGNPYYDPAKPHHTPDGFRNNYNDKVEKPLGHVLRWQWEAYRDGLPKPAQTPTPTVAPDLALIKGYTRNAQPTVTWIGHATLLVQAGGLNVLTDPVFSERASPLQIMGPKRAQPPGVAMDDLPPIDVVVISHNHYDHLDRASVEQLNLQAGGPPLFLVPLGVREWFLALGITNVKEMDWWDKTVLDNLDIYFVPATHWSARGVFDRSETLWGGWVIQAAAQQAGAEPFSVYFAGDTGYSKDFRDIGERFGRFDLALIPIGAYAPRWFMQNQHVDPAQAVLIHEDVRAKRSVAIHWGTFELADDPLDEPPKELAKALREAGLPQEQFVTLKHGETLKLDQ